MKIAVAGLALALSIAPAFSIAPAYADDPAFCRHYADLALWQYHKAKDIPNCYQGDNAVWTPNFDHHFTWCLGVSHGQAMAGEDIRGNRLKQCNMAAYGHL